MFSLLFTRKELFSDPVGPFVAIFIAVSVPLINGIVSLLVSDAIGFKITEPINAFAAGMLWIVMCDIGLATSYCEPPINRTWGKVFEEIKNLRYHSWLFWLSMVTINVLACAINTFIIIAIEVEPSGLESLAIMLVPMLWAMSSFGFAVTPKGLRHPPVS